MSKQSAYTLFELMIVLSLLAIITTQAVLPMWQALDQQRAHHDCQRIVQMIQMAQQLAFSGKQTITLCPSADGRHCSMQWQEQFFILTRFNYEKNVTETFQVARLSSACQLSGNSFLARNRFIFQTEFMHAASNGSIACQYAAGKHKIQIHINQIGNIRYEEA